MNGTADFYHSVKIILWFYINVKAKYHNIMLINFIKAITNRQQLSHIHLR